MTRQQARAELAALPMRPPSLVMDLERLGCLHGYALSFMRILTRRMSRENWQFKRAQFDLDAEGYGEAVYTITTPNDVFSLAVFSQYLDPDVRSDRVIAEQWDVTMALRAGELSHEVMAKLRANVPLQENGRVDSECLVLSRANKSERNFKAVLEAICAGRQPDMNKLAKVGYLYRTTAVYGSGKFGMADWAKVQTRYPDFASPFAAEMLVCYLIRQFSLDKLHHMAGCRAPETAVHLSGDIQRYIGIGNATGLGMAPYLLNHPLLIARWIEIRETALGRVRACGDFTPAERGKVHRILTRACQHLSEIDTDNTEQNECNHDTRSVLGACLSKIISGEIAWQSADDLIDYSHVHLPLECQELINCALIETRLDLVEDLEAQLSLDEGYLLDPSMPLTQLKTLIETRYDWALGVDFAAPDETATFWYRSEEKMEPRLGRRGAEPGEDKEIYIGIALAIREAYAQLVSYMTDHADKRVAHFVMAHPHHRYIVRRIQTMSQTYYGDIRANLLHADVLPINLLRCKLSFFGVSKFDPRSRLWVRNTMFQGAPVMDEIGPNCTDDWAFPVRPDHDPLA